MSVIRMTTAGACCLVGVIAAASVAGRTGTAQDVRTPAMPGETGFHTIVVQAPPGAEPDSFARAVVDALPPTLNDPAQNFMRDPAAQAGAPYRLVMVFHGTADPPRADICADVPAAAASVPSPPPSGSIAPQPTSLTAAFCDRDRPLSQAHSRISGGVDPTQASFRFLVADVTKQLFPLGFATLPGRSGTAGSTLPPTGTGPVAPPP